jgi:hypothetical protein
VESLEKEKFTALGGQERVIEVVIGRAQGLLHAWQHAHKNSREQVQQQHQVQPWKPPPTGFCQVKY